MKPRRVQAACGLAFRQKPCVEWERQQVFQLMARFDALQVRKHDLQVAAELPEHLAARSARRRGLLGVCDDHDSTECAMTFGNRLEHRNPLGANREAVSRVFDVAAGDNLAVRRLERRSNLEVGEAGVGIRASLACGLMEVGIEKR